MPFSKPVGRSDVSLTTSVGSMHGSGQEERSKKRPATTSLKRPLIATINATPLAFDPVEIAFSEEFPRGRLWHLLDDALLSEVQEAERLSPRLERRMMRLIDHAVQEGADAILLTCSAYSPVVDIARKSSHILVLKPDEAMFDQIIEKNPQRIGLLATVEAAVEPAVNQLARKARSRNQQTEVLIACRPEAMEAVHCGDVDRCIGILVEAAEELAGRGAKLLVLAQYSITSVRGAVATATNLPVHSGPHAAAAYLRELMNQNTSADGAVDLRKEQRSNLA